MSTSPSDTQAPEVEASPFQALVFDLGGVLVAHDNAVMYARLAQHCAGDRSPEAVVRLMRGTDWSAGTPVSALHEQLRAELGYAPGWDGFVADWCCHFDVDDSMLAFVERLAAHNRVMLFSNTNQQHWDFLVDATDGRLARLEPYLSHEIGLTKPSIRSFEAVAEKAGIDPARSVFFDDMAENVEGARRAGFQAELFESEAKLATFLTGKGVRLD
ncbi:MAG TPA: HAD-IA family hydrolase [Caulobacteraceae bacterium]|jgi:putative hydrolase of the HAD superfamily|nr:HAD-IA family hydrolase [Caulobacteraceae bacterium]